MSDAADNLADKHWFVVSDSGLVVGRADHEQSTADRAGRRCWSSLTAWILWRTAFGLRLRSCGENPRRAESLGVNVYRYKYIAVLMSGAFAGIGGGFLALVASSGFTERADRRPRLHRPGRDDLRQLASRRDCSPARCCSATPTACTLRGGAGSVHACCC